MIRKMKNTLPKALTSSFFKTEDGYDKLKEAWKIASNSTEVHTSNLGWLNVIYLIARGKDWRKSFSPILNQVKLDNGYNPYTSASINTRNALYYIKFKSPKITEAFGDIFSDEFYEKVAGLVPKTNSEELPQSAYL